MRSRTPARVRGRRDWGQRDWVLRAFGRAVGGLLAALVVTFLLYLPYGRRLLPLHRPVPGVSTDRTTGELARWFGFEVAQPFLFQFAEFALSRLTHPLVAVPFALCGALAVAVALGTRRS
ncbi:hypothetical protein ACFQMA_07565 [Halosimplex aquaticum]|uniref:Peptide/nickel transport system permease protein n=1 Tax=Halosimplex aquaticum TaxID=3026162 RepID=A0ABD5XYH3_9EURY|nr:hypothetical protein [Halosimplex aquaticum]